MRDQIAVLNYRTFFPSLQVYHRYFLPTATILFRLRQEHTPLATCPVSVTVPP